MRVHDSQSYRKLDVTKERISRILELREILLSIQTGFSLVNAAVVCAILEGISGLEHPCEWCAIHSGQVFHQLVCPLSVVLPQIFFNLIHCSPIQFSLAFFMHLLMLLFTSLYFAAPSGSNV